MECAFQGFKRARVKRNIISEISDVDGAGSLHENDKKMLIDAIQKGNSERTEILPETTNSSRGSKTTTFPPASVRKAKLRNSNIPSMKILFTNADQLTESKMSELLTKINQEKPLIVAVSEVKMKNSTKDRVLEDYQIPNYNLHPINLLNDNGRGMAIYTHTSIEKSTVEIKLDSKFEEVCLLEIRLRGGDVMLFCCCYRSPTPSDKSEENNNKLNRLLKMISNKKYSHRCIVGDFNFRGINWTNWTTQCSENSVEAKFIEAVRDCYFFQHMTEPTRCRGKDKPSLIDLLFTDEEMNVSDIQQHSPLGKSDHSVIVFNYHCYLNYSKPKDSFSYSKGDYNSMRENMDESEWKKKFMENANSQNVEEMSSLKNKLKEMVEQFIPKVTTTGKPSWSDKGVFPVSEKSLDAIREKKRSHRKWIAALKNGDAENERLLYCKARGKVKTVLRKEKRNFEKGIALKAKNNPKAFWSHARRKLKTKVGVAPLLSDPTNKDSLKFEDTEKANTLQKQFSSVFTKEPDGDIPRISRRCKATILVFRVTDDMTMKLIDDLNPNKSIGPDGVHARLLIEL